MQKSTILIAFLLIAGVSASPAPTLGLLGGIFDTLTNIVGETINVIGNVAGGIVGNAVSLAGGVLDTAGNIIGNLISLKVNAAGQIINGATAIVEGVVDAAGNIIGRVVNDDGVATNVSINVAGNVFNTGGKLLGNIFAVKGNVLKVIANSINGIVGVVTQIAGNILRVQIYVFGRFVKVMANLIGLLSKLSNNLVNIFASVLNKLTSFLSDIITTFDKFFTAALVEFNDFIVNPPLKTAKAAYEKVVTSVTAAVAKAKTNIADQVNKFDAKMKDEVAAAVNKVNNLASNLTQKLNLANVSPELKAKCGKQLNSSLEIFGGKDIPYLTECLEFDLDAIANKAVTTVGGTVTQAKALAASLRKCLNPATASPKDTAAKTTAKECLVDMTKNAPIEEAAMIAIIDKAVADLTTELDAADKATTDCLKQKSDEAVLGAQYVEYELDECLAGR